MSELTYFVVPRLIFDLALLAFLLKLAQQLLLGLCDIAQDVLQIVHFSLQTISRGLQLLELARLVVTERKQLGLGDQLPQLEQLLRVLLELCCVTVFGDILQRVLVVDEYELLRLQILVELLLEGGSELRDDGVLRLVLARSRLLFAALVRPVREHDDN